MSLARTAFVVFAKDVRIEARTREILVTAGFFALLITILAAVAFPASADAAGGAVWIPLSFSAVLAVGRTWQREREEGAFVGLLTSPVPRASIFFGKMFGTLLFLCFVAALVVPAVALFFHLDLLPSLGSLVMVILLGLLGVASLATLFGVMTVRTRARDLVLASILFPLISPVLLVGVSATSKLFENGAIATPLGDYLLLLGVFDFVSILAGATLFGALVEE